MVASTKLYDILGVDPGADTATIKKAYRKKAMKYHPDRHSSASVEDKKVAENKFKEISNAHDVLSDEKKRQIYDQLGDEGLQRAAADAGMNGGGMPDIIAELLRRGGGFPFNMGGMGGGGRSGGGMPGKNNTAAEIGITLEEAYKGCTKRIPRRWQRRCPNCDGCGAARKEDIIECAGCNGQGVRIEVIRHPMGIIQQQRSCSACSGKGKSIKSGSECGKCLGKKVIHEDKEYKIRFPAGTKDGCTCEFKGEGEWDPVWPLNKPLGDIIFVARLQYDTNNCPYKLEGGHHLVLRKSISLRDALTGVNFAIKTMDDRYVMVSSDKILQSGDCLVVKGEGMPKMTQPIKNTDMEDDELESEEPEIGEKGDLHIYIEVVYPTDRTINKIVDREKMEKTMSLLFRENPTTKVLDGRFHEMIGIPPSRLEDMKIGEQTIGKPEVTLRYKIDGPPPMDDSSSSSGNRGRTGSGVGDDDEENMNGPQCVHQ